MKWTRTRAAGALAAAAAAALALSACTGNEEAIPTAPPTREPVTITVHYWGNFGLTESDAGPSLVSVYEAEHPWINLEMVVGEYGATHDALTQALQSGGSGGKVYAIDEGYITGFVAEAESFINLLDLGAGQYEDAYLPWKWDQAANADGSVVIGLGYDVEGLALCYRKDLFEAAGLPSDRDEVSAALGDSWDDFIAFGQEYRAATGKRFVDNATNIMNPAVWQLGTGHGYLDRNDELDMDNVKPAFDVFVGVLEAGLSAGIGAWSPEWNAGFTNGDFAVLPCPAWMLGYIEEKVAADPTFAGQWDIADLPGPGGNWGGSFYTIPKQGTAYEQQEAYNFLEWLIQHEQQLNIMAETGKLPAQTAILDSDAVAGLTNEFFNDAPYGEIFAKTVLDVPAPVYHSRCEGAVRTVIETSLNNVQAGNAVFWGWDDLVEDAEAAADRCFSETG